MTQVLRELRAYLTVQLMNLAARVDAEAFVACCEAVGLALDLERRERHAYDPDARRN
jgi:hypothetical protein